MCINMEVKHVSVTYPSGTQALRNLSLQMQPPNLIGILGPNGAGKTTLLKLLISSLLPTSGEILFDGKPLADQEKSLKAQLGYLPQTFGLYDELTVWQFIDYMAALKGVREKAAVEGVLARVSLTGQHRVRIGALSGGQRQRVGIAQALLGDPRLLILDEPTVGLDPEERVRFRNLFSEMARDKIVLLSTHIVEDVQSICNRVLVLHHGEILFDGDPADLIREAIGHVGVYVSRLGDATPEGCVVVSKVNVAQGIQCRIVADTLPDHVELVEPTLEDAYLLCIGKGAGVS